jgi:hypothetical protein
MVIITSFTLNLNPVSGIFTTTSYEASLCPFYNGNLACRDMRPRFPKSVLGDARHFSLRRLKCNCCGVLHTEIPNTIQPFKHYDSAAIQCVLDGSPDAAMCVADDSTIRRWKAAFMETGPDISQRLTSIRARMSEEKIPALEPEEILNQIRGREKHWLAFVMALLINNGHKLCTRFAFCPNQFKDIVSIKHKSEAEGGQKNDETFNDSS